MSIVLKGVIHGKRIELERDSGLPDGESVSVTIQPARQLPDQMQNAFGAWESEAGEVDAFVREVYALRKPSESRDIEP